MVRRVLLTIFLSVFGASLAHAESLARAERVSIPAGIIIHCRVAQTLTTRLNNQGDPFTATVSEPVVFDGQELIPVGATLEGRIAYMKRPGRIRGVGVMRLTPERISFPDGRSLLLSATLLTAYGAEKAKVVGTEGTIKGPNSRLQTAEEVGGGSAVGSAVGLIFGHPWVGVAVGGTAGFLDRMRRRGQDLHIPSGTQLNYQLTRPLEVDRVHRHETAARRSPLPGN